ncbi:MAG: hypothetical protein OZ913_08530 [Ignavibacteriaceae bacterium]|nr:MAG: hypothetical protein EDM69_10170 [Chlorobiota bacterium]KXK03124.1 MAG: hypothetical protein UZ04_CHB001001515 [Chlorobi bacterium OLB4]MBV6397847.1 hypothetical protein [Ignavibacteria bacterium]MCC6886899.1 hypothetical protein [Ignavibacteriales bacterium]MCE7953987.1 hypothetical protein [Chlorobi bacterium CHB7]MDL1887887.1 hypothetical protein [Ignavibacteria bacterium CHB1]MEB2330326.1 hypothetical protein [Ignavibacteriaceae bacterium]OQY76788.1 MAG: hypothetical protein B6D4
MLPKSAKYWLTFLIAFAIVWLGAINVRFLIGNELLIFDEFNFRTAIPPDEEETIFRMVANSSILIICSYILTLIAAIGFVRTCKLNFKENPWLLMNCILFFIFVPVELYTAYLDYRFITLFFSKPENHDQLLKIFGERIGFLKGTPWVAMLSYYCIIIISVFQPLKKSKAELNILKKKFKEQYSYEYILHEEDDLAVKDN